MNYGLGKKKGERKKWDLLGLVEDPSQHLLSLIHLRPEVSLLPASSSPITARVLGPGPSP